MKNDTSAGALRQQEYFALLFYPPVRCVSVYHSRVISSDREEQMNQRVRCEERGERERKKKQEEEDEDGAIASSAFHVERKRFEISFTHSQWSLLISCVPLLQPLDVT